MLKENYITKEWRQQGVSLTEDADHVLELRHQGEVVARFSQTGATVENILKVSREVIEGVN